MVEVKKQVFDYMVDFLSPNLMKHEKNGDYTKKLHAILEAVPFKTTIVGSHTSYLTNYLRKTDKECWVDGEVTAISQATIPHGPQHRDKKRWLTSKILCSSALWGYGCRLLNQQKDLW